MLRIPGPEYSILIWKPRHTAQGKGKDVYTRKHQLQKSKDSILKKCCIILTTVAESQVDDTVVFVELKGINPGHYFILCAVAFK